MGSSTISGSAASAFNNIIINKGSTISSIVEANGPGAISNTGNLSIANGLFKITTGTFQFAGVTGPTIPATGGVWVNGATLNTGNFSTTFNGLLRVTSGGVANFGASAGNSLEINNGGGTLFAFLDMQGGIINVAGRLFINNRGTLMMSGGTINVNTLGTLNNSTNASFEVTATSHINALSGGTIILQNPNLNTTGGDLLITSGVGTKTITGGTFQIGNNSTPAGKTFIVNSSIPLYNFTINNTNSPSIQLTGNDLTIASTLTLNGGNIDAATNSRKAIVSNSAAGAIARTNGFVIGNLQRAIFGISTVYNFPVGTAINEYSPASIQLALGSFSSPDITVKAQKGKPANYGGSDYINRYWNVTVDGITSTPAALDITTTYLPADVIGSVTGINMSEYTGSSWTPFTPANNVNHTLTADNASMTDGTTMVFGGLGVAADATTTVVSSDDPTVCQGDPIIFTATVTTSGTNTPTGDVDFFDNGNPIPAGTGATLNGAGTASFTISTLGPGTHTITAIYNGDTNNDPSPISAGYTQNINAIPATPTATANGSNPLTLCAGQTLNLSTPNAGAGTAYSWTGPNGFSDNVRQPSIPNITTAGGGTYSVTITQNGCTSAAGTVDVTVNPGPATPTVTATPNPLCEGQTLNLSTPNAGAGNGIQLDRTKWI
jgi:hypothetical protein